MENKCPICARPATIDVEDEKHPFARQVRCGACGKYFITESIWEGDGLEDALENDPLFHEKLERYLWETRDEANRLISSDPVGNWPGTNLTLAEISQKYKDDVSQLQKYENTVRRLADRTPKFGPKFNTIDDRWMVPTFNEAEAVDIIRDLAKNGLIAISQETNDGNIEYSITLTGLAYAEELGKQPKVDRKIGFRSSD